MGGGSCFSVKSLEADELELQPLERQHHEVKNEGFTNWRFTEFCLSDLQTATNDFDSNLIISENPSIDIYKGTLRNNLGFVAIKRFKNSPWHIPDFFKEDALSVGNLNHKRLVPLLGYCYDEVEDVGFLVSEFMPNGSLANPLFHRQTMDWPMRLSVAHHIAEALVYCNTSHYDSYSNLTADSVLFDKDGEARLSSFGLVMEIIFYYRRTRACLRPENVTYRFGTILVNLLTGKQFPLTQYLEMISGKDVTEVMDPNLEGKYSSEVATEVLKFACECLQSTDIADKNLVNKELVAILEKLHSEAQVLYSETTEEDEVGASSSQQQEADPLQALFSDQPVITKQEEEASSSNQEEHLGVSGVSQPRDEQ